MCADLQVTGQQPRQITRAEALQLAAQRGIQNAEKLTNEQLMAALNGIGATSAPAGVDGTHVTHQTQESSSIRGAELERTPKPEDKSVVARTQTQTTSLANLTSAMTKAGFNLDEKAAAELKTQLIAAGISVDESGNIDTSNPETLQKLNTTLAQFAQSKQETQLQFDKSTDQKFIDKMVSEGSIRKNEDGTYTVLDKAKAEALLNHVDQEPTSESQPPVELAVDAQTTTETTRREHAVEVEDNLKHNRAGRKKAESDFKAELEKWAADPENEDTMNYSIAQNKYSGKIQKQMKKIQKETDNSPAEILQKYYSNYATEDEKLALAQAFSEVSTNEDELLKTYRRVTGDKKATFEGDTGERKRQLAALMTVAEDPNFDTSMLTERMAAIDVMGNRSAKRVAKDKKAFIADEAKRQTKAAETMQNVENTEVHFSKEQRKAGKKEDPTKEHTDIGKIGRKLVTECPDEFCEAGTAADHDLEVDGKYYKFSEAKWKNFAAEICDSRGLDDRAQDGFDEDGNLTLKEGRNAWLSKTLVTKDGQVKTLEQIIGNKNGKVGNRELNELRDMIKSSGYSVDRNKTGAKRFGRVMAYMGLGALGGAAGAMGGSLIGGAVTVAGNTAYSGVTADRTIHDSTTFKFNNNGEEFTQKVNKNIHVDGQEYSGEVAYRDKGQHHIRTGAYGAALSGLGGAITGLATMGKVHAKGRNFDGIVRLTKDKTDETIESSKIKLTIPQSKTVTVRSGQITEQSEVPTRKAVRYRGPEAYTVLYQINGSEIPAKYRRAVYQKLDQMWRDGTNGKKGDVPRNIPVYGSFTINVGGQEITVTRKDNWDKVHIQEGRPGGRGGVYNSGASESRTYRGKGKFIG